MHEPCMQLAYRPIEVVICGGWKAIYGIAAHSSPFVHKKPKKTQKLEAPTRKFFRR